MNGVISGTLKWFAHPMYDEQDITFWMCGLALVLCAAFLWSTVVRSIVE